MPHAYLRPLLALLCLSALGGCSYRYDKPGAELSAVSGAVGFEDVRSQVLSVSCQRCHDKTLPHLGDFPSARAAREAIRRSVFETKTMPKNGSLTAKQSALLLSWLDAGAPEIPGAASPSSQPGSGGGKVLWKDLRARVLDVNCNGCHGPRNKKGISDFTSLQTFRASISTVLYLALIEKKKPMPPLPARLSAEEKRLLTDWIIGGELDDEGKGPNAVSAEDAPEARPSESRLTYHLQKPAQGQEAIRFRIGYFLGTHEGTADGATAQAEARNGEHFELTSVSVKVPVAGLRTGDDTRDCHVREALGLDYTRSPYPGEHVCDDGNLIREPLAFPEIRLELRDHALTIPAGETFADVEVPATLTIHGQSKPGTRIPLHIELVNGSKQKLRVTSRFDVGLKDFGVVVKPVFLGMSVHDTATVNVDLTLVSDQAQAPGPFEGRSVTFDSASGQPGAVHFDIDYFAGTHHGLARSVSGELELQLGEAFSLGKARFRVPVDSLDTENSTRDCHLREALGLEYGRSRFPEEHACDAEDRLPESGPDSLAFPDIEFELESYTVPNKQKGLQAGDSIEILARMRVKIHGVSKSVTIPARLRYQDSAKGLLALESFFSLSLADFGIIVKPVVGNFGTVTDEVRVNVQLGFSPRKP